MRSVARIVLLLAVSGLVLGVSVAGAQTTRGSLSIEQGSGVVILEIRGALLGRVQSGTLRVTDLTPTDRYTPMVVGRRVVRERAGPRTVVYRGVGLRFRMVGGGYKIVLRGEGISISAVGRGVVSLVGDPKLSSDATGIYALDGTDCRLEPELCLPLPSQLERHVLGARQNEDEPPSKR